MASHSNVAHPLTVVVGAALAVLLAAGARAQQVDYLVGPQDVLAVTVADQPALSGKFTVVADGTLTYPLIGAIRVGGLSVQAVERQLTARLSEGYLTKPIVSVILEQAASQYVLVTGEVRQAGRYPLSGRTTVLEALLKAGVLAESASTSDILVVRAQDGSETAAGPETLHVSLDALQRGDASQNVALRSGDMIFVPRTEPNLTVYVMGLVKTPGMQTVPRGSTVLQAIARAGGVAERGSIGRLKLIAASGTRTSR